MPPSTYRYAKIPFHGTIVVSTDDDEIVIELNDGLPINAKLVGIAVVSPDLDDTDTFTIALEEVDGDDEYILYSNATLAESTPHRFIVDANDMPINIPMSGIHQVRITTSGGQASDRDFSGYLLIEK